MEPYLSDKPRAAAALIVAAARASGILMWRLTQARCITIGLRGRGRGGRGREGGGKDGRGRRWERGREDGRGEGKREGCKRIGEERARGRDWRRERERGEKGQTDGEWR